MLGRLGALLAQIARRPTEHARRLRAFPRFLNRPVPLWFALGQGIAFVLMFGLVAVASVSGERGPAGPPGPRGAQGEMGLALGETVYVCDPSLAAKLDNQTKDTSARTGTASFDNESASSVSDPGGGALATGQTAIASSGNAVNGQVTDIEASGCAQVNANLTNTCLNCRAETGDADASNEARAAVGEPWLASPLPSPSPSPEVVELLTPTASATAVTPSQSPPA